MAVTDAVHFLTVGAELGEGPIWIDGRLWFVDIKGRLIYRHDPATGDTMRWQAPDMVGWILPTVRGDLIAGLRSGPHRFDATSGSFDPIVTVDAAHAGNRLNDAAVDTHGRIVFGTMDNDESQPSGRVYLLDRGTVHATPIAPTVITNGPAVSPAGDRLYHVDTLQRAIVVHGVSPDGSIGPAEPFLQFSGNEGFPDGAVCDSGGGIWVGFYGGWAARRFSADGVQTDQVDFPVANVTKVALGGSDGRTAYATTARQGLDAAGLAAQPLAGDVFTFRVEVPAPPPIRTNN